MRTNALLFCLVVAAACGKSSNQPAGGSGTGSAGSALTPPSSGDAAPAVAVDAANAADAGAAPAGPAPDPTAKAKELLDAQVAALKTSDGNAALLATFRPDAVALVPDPREVKDPSLGIRDAIAYASAQEPVKSVKQGKLVAGGNGSAIWVNTTLEFTVAAKKPRTVRVTELMAAPDWKVVAAAFTDDRAPSAYSDAQTPVPGTSSPGPLAALLGSPTELDAALASDSGVALFGTDKAEVAFDAAAAHKVLGGWKSLKLSVDGAREVREAQWGYVQGNVAWDKGEKAPRRLIGMLIAVPAAGGKWSVVAANYGAL